MTDDDDDLKFLYLFKEIRLVYDWKARRFTPDDQQEIQDFFAWSGKSFEKGIVAKAEAHAILNRLIASSIDSSLLSECSSIVMFRCRNKVRVKSTYVFSQCERCKRYHVTQVSAFENGGLISAQKVLFHPYQDEPFNQLR